MRKQNARHVVGSVYNYDQTPKEQPRYKKNIVRVLRKKKRKRDKRIASQQKSSNGKIRLHVTYLRKPEDQSSTTE